MNGDDEEGNPAKQAGQRESKGEEQPEMQPDTNAEPGPERHGQAEDGRGITEIIPGPATLVVITILPNHAVIVAKRDWNWPNRYGSRSATATSAVAGRGLILSLSVKIDLSAY